MEQGRPVLSFGISSILGPAFDRNGSKKVTDTARRTSAEKLAPPTSLREDERAEAAAYDGDTTASEGVASPTDPVKDTAFDGDAATTSQLGCEAGRGGLECVADERGDAAAVTFPLMPCISPHALLLKPVDRYRPNSLANEYRRVGHPYSNRTPAKRKKPRTTFSRDQIAELEARFLGQKYLASTERLRLAKHLQLTDAQVKTWFQNRRTKWRRQTAEEREAERNAATKYIMKMQESAAMAAAFWSPLLNFGCRRPTVPTTSQTHGRLPPRHESSSTPPP